jgi:hypothetical protein
MTNVAELAERYTELEETVTELREQVRVLTWLLAEQAHARAMAAQASKDLAEQIRVRLQSRQRTVPMARWKG